MRSEMPNISGSLATVPLGYDTNYDPYSFGSARGGDVALYEGAAGTRRLLTDDTQPEFFPRISDGRVAWYAWDGNDLEVYLWQDEVVVLLTDNGVEDREVRISENDVAWIRWDGNDYEIFFYDGTDTHQVTDDQVNQLMGDVPGDTVAYREWTGANWDVFTATRIGPGPGVSALGVLHRALLVVLLMAAGVGARAAYAKRSAPGLTPVVNPTDGP